MGDESQKSNLKSEWSLLIKSFVEDQHEEGLNKDSEAHQQNSSKATGQLIDDSLLRLSQKKHAFLKNIDEIKNKRDEMQFKFDEKKLSKSEVTIFYHEINLLNQKGRSLSQKLELIDQEIRRLRELKDSKTEI